MPNPVVNAWDPYYTVTKGPLPVGEYVRSMLFSQYVEEYKNKSEAMKFVQFGSMFHRRVIGDGTFEFRYFHLDLAHFSSFWYLEFYRQFGFVGTTGLPDAIQLSTETTSRPTYPTAGTTPSTIPLRVCPIRGLSWLCDTGIRVGLPSGTGD
jgi:hypothetical protein